MSLPSGLVSVSHFNNIIHKKDPLFSRSPFEYIVFELQAVF